MTAQPPHKIQLVRIAHAYYKYADLEKARQFFVDFGFTEERTLADGNGESEKIYFRGYGAEPWVICASRSEKPAFGGSAFVVESEEDLRIAAETLPQASDIYELHDAPGGGRCVTFFDPVDGWPMHLVYGQRSAEMLDIPLPNTPVNYVSYTPFPYPLGGEFLCLSPRLKGGILSRYWSQRTTDTHGFLPHKANREEPSTQ